MQAGRLYACCSHRLDLGFTEVDKCSAASPSSQLRFIPIARFIADPCVCRNDRPSYKTLKEIHDAPLKRPKRDHLLVVRPLYGALTCRGVYTKAAGIKDAPLPTNGGAPGPPLTALIGNNARR